MNNKNSLQQCVNCIKTHFTRNVVHKLSKKYIMGIILNKKKHYYTRFPLLLALICVFTLSQFITGFIGAYFSEIITGKNCHEGNCFWGAISWFGFITIPAGLILLVTFFIITIIDSFKIKKNHEI